MMAKLEPKECFICKELFQPNNRRVKTCGKKECKKERSRRQDDKRTRMTFSKGKIWILDMSLPEKEWCWVKDERGD